MSNASRAKQARRLSRAFDQGAILGCRVIAGPDLTDALAVASALEDTGPVYGQIPGGDPEPVCAGPDGVPVVIVPGDVPMHRVRTLHRAWAASWVDDLAPVVVLERDVTLDDLILRRPPAGVDAPGVPVTAAVDGLARDLGSGDWLVRGSRGVWGAAAPGVARAVAEVDVLRRVSVMETWGGVGPCDVHDDESVQWWAGVLRCPVALVRSALGAGVAR